MKLPHRREMLLIDEVLDFTREHIRTKSIIKKDNAFLEDGKFPVFKSVELMAQSLGALRGELHENSANRLGFLIGVRRFKIKKPFIEVGSEIITSVRVSLQDESGLGMHDCEVFENGNLIASASISTLNPSDEFLSEFLRKDSE